MPKRTAPHNILSHPEVYTSRSANRQLLYKLKGLSTNEMYIVKDTVTSHEHVARCSLRGNRLLVTTRISIRQRGNTAKLRDLMQELSAEANDKVKRSRRQARPAKAKQRGQEPFRRAPRRQPQPGTYPAH